MYCRSSSGSTIKDSGGEGQAQPPPKPKDKVINLLDNVQKLASDDKLRDEVMRVREGGIEKS